MTFEVRQRFLVRRDWDVVYEPGAERTVLTHTSNDDEEQARRSIINRNLEVGIQTLAIQRVD